ncbi:hypothetical protein DY000_02060907 [Brassica cretica]|uniref:SKP1 component POZ domain-containing protein n=1 Tax=Brassica cretica TaxID=69181 RepID=A0ABQ7B162_BRACR|nr:hypothetical protein DY000_02060907 [Brassica cretica]
MKIFVKTLKGTNFEIEVNPAETVTLIPEFENISVLITFIKSLILPCGFEIVNLGVTLI